MATEQELQMLEESCSECETEDHEQDSAASQPSSGAESAEEEEELESEKRGELLAAKLRKLEKKILENRKQAIQERQQRKEARRKRKEAENRKFVEEKTPMMQLPPPPPPPPAPAAPSQSPTKEEMRMDVEMTIESGGIQPRPASKHTNVPLLNLYSTTDIRLPAKSEINNIPTGLCVEIPPKTIGLITPKRSLSDQMVCFHNSPMVVIGRPQIWIPLQNCSDRAYEIRRGETIAQLSFIRSEMVSVLQFFQNCAKSRSQILQCCFKAKKFH